MSQALPSASNCCYPCAEPVITTTPGPQGDAGADGADGADGLNAYTVLTAAFTMPAELANVTVEVNNSDWMTVGQKVFIGKLSSAARGTFEVISKPDSAHAILENMEDTPNSAYIDNSAPGTVFPNGSAVSPSGLQGPKGVDGTSGAPTTAHYVTTQTEAGLSAEFSLGSLTTGMLKHTVAAGVSTPATASDGTDYLSSTTGLTKAGNLSGVANQATSRANIGIAATAIATQLANAVAFTGGAISGCTGAFTTLAATDTTTLVGRLVLSPIALQTLGAASTVAMTGPKIRVVGNAGPVTVGTTPTCDNGTADGQEVLIQGTHDTNTVTLQDSGTLPGSRLRLGAATRALGAGDTLRLSWDATLATWVETSFVALV